MLTRRPYFLCLGTFFSLYPPPLPLSSPLLSSPLLSLPSATTFPPATNSFRPSEAEALCNFPPEDWILDYNEEGMGERKRRRREEGERRQRRKERESVRGEEGEVIERNSDVLTPRKGLQQHILVLFENHNYKYLTKISQVINEKNSEKFQSLKKEIKRYTLKSVAYPETPELACSTFTSFENISKLFAELKNISSWTPETHLFFPASCKARVFEILLIHTNTCHPLSLLPNDILWVILSMALGPWTIRTWVQNYPALREWCFLKFRGIKQFDFLQKLYWSTVDW
jgi:hypothetical protein